ncbi:MAG: shikimate dehydrogenase [Planctomycetaceae bacterium]|nr:shikimate dehydrogenase [Planctomycetaceae bacterium]
MPSPAVQPLLALVAPHVGGNPTQYVFERAFAHHELDWRYLTFEIELERFAAAVQGLKSLGFRGGHCDGVFQEHMLASVDQATDTASQVGAANVVDRNGDSLIGDNTDGAAVLAAMKRIGTVAGKHVVLLGAGRVARAVAVALVSDGVNTLTVANRSESRAVDLANLLTDRCSPTTAIWSADFLPPPDVDVLINATSLGADPKDPTMPTSPDAFRPGLLVVDVAAYRARTPWLDAAAHRGCAIVDGLTVFLEQAAISFQRWTGVEPDRRIMREAAEEFLGF